MLANKTPPSLNKVSFLCQCQVISNEIFVRKAVAIQKNNIITLAGIHGPIEDLCFAKPFVFLAMVIDWLSEVFNDL